MANKANFLFVFNSILRLFTLLFLLRKLNHRCKFQWKKKKYKDKISLKRIVSLCIGQIPRIIYVYIWKTPKSYGHVKVRWSALKSDGLPRQSPMLSEYTFVTSRHGKVIGKVSVFIQKWIKQKGTKGKNFKNES